MNPVRWLARRRDSITKRLTRVLVKAFRELTTYHFRNAEEFADFATPLVFAAQRELAKAVSEAITEHTRREFNRPGLAAPSIPDSETINLRGVPTQNVYRRPFETIWNELAERDREDEELPFEDLFSDIVDEGVDRLQAIADEDLQLTYGHAAREAMQRQPDDIQPTWWKREVRGPRTCALCLIVSTKRFSTSELNPLHPHCDCEVVPMYGEKPGMVIDEDRLNEVHERVLKELGVWSASGKPDSPEGLDYRQLIFEITEEHGELGEMLTRVRSEKAYKVLHNPLQ